MRVLTTIILGAALLAAAPVAWAGEKEDMAKLFEPLPKGMDDDSWRAERERREAAHDAVQYDPLGAAWAYQIRLADANTIQCMQEYQTALLHNGERSRKALLEKSVELCSRGMREVYNAAGRSNQEALGKANAMAGMTLNYVLAGQR